MRLCVCFSVSVCVCACLCVLTAACCAGAGGSTAPPARSVTHLPSATYLPSLRYICRRYLPTARYLPSLSVTIPTCLGLLPRRSTRLSDYARGIRRHAVRTMGMRVVARKGLLVSALKTLIERGMGVVLTRGMWVSALKELDSAPLFLCTGLNPLTSKVFDHHATACTSGVSVLASRMHLNVQPVLSLPALIAICLLLARYAMSGTDTAYDATRTTAYSRPPSAPSWYLVCYACATRCPVLR